MKKSVIEGIKKTIHVFTQSSRTSEQDYHIHAVEEDQEDNAAHVSVVETYPAECARDC